MSDLTSAIKQICEEKGLSYDAVIGTIESALAAAYRKDFGAKNQNIKVEFDPESTTSKVFDVKTVVEDLPEEELDENGEPIFHKEDEVAEKDEKKKDKSSDSKDAEEKNKDKAEKKESKDVEEGIEEEEEKKFNPKTDMQITDAKMIKKTAKVGDELKMKLEIPEAYGRMAAQTAKQVIIQRLREAERDMILNEFKDKEGEVVSGVVQRREGRIVLIDLGKAVGVLPQDEQIRGEKYLPGERVKIYIKEVRPSTKGPEIIVSRTSGEILKKVFYLEIPEISNGLIELKAVAREAGARAKVAVFTDSDNVDPIGSCVGQRGARIQTIIKELGGEKVDIIEWDDEPEKFIANALSPSKIISIETKDENRAVVSVAEDQLSLAIGKGGQNARLAANLTGWKIDIVVDGEEAKRKKDDKNSSESEIEENKDDSEEEAVEAVEEKDEKENKKDGKEKVKEEKKAVKKTKKKSSEDETTEDKKDKEE